MSIAWWTLTVIGGLFVASDLRDRDWFGAFLATGLTISALACALTS